MMNFPHGCYKKNLKTETFITEYLFTPVYYLFNTLRTGLLNCSRGLTFRHRASCI